MAQPVRIAVKDANGIAFDPASLPHAYSYDTNGNRLTDTCFEQGAVVRQKTFTYVQINDVWLIETESAWDNITQSWRA
jgi:hypothetical protein